MRIKWGNVTEVWKIKLLSMLLKLMWQTQKCWVQTSPELKKNKFGLSHLAQFKVRLNILFIVSTLHTHALGDFCMNNNNKKGTMRCEVGYFIEKNNWIKLKRFWHFNGNRRIMEEWCVSVDCTHPCEALVKAFLKQLWERKHSEPQFHHLIYVHKCAGATLENLVFIFQPLW